ncbi:hypothetical protein Celaphus_00016591 [Cervus elaphus hippelaphus]|uniref:Uncharacterized protein n=1 Tax=Cervus elaphus hippelaphus TaxID=46360 RepID=A0A212C4J8_CEREH|nr:hypothetical protein Celaphus_00016591 [Cervus elaphus hippelaphus]
MQYFLVKKPSLHRYLSLCIRA